MKRAAILIGVDKTGDLPKLKDAARGALLMKTWAQAQGLDPVHVFTDAQGPVTVDAIKRAIKDMVDAANVGQLLIYFAGHGVNLQRQEYWLLSDAPDDSQAAVNVATSAAFAATCGIPHVVFMSDACRTAPEGIRAQSVRGSEIFPNREADAKPVDQFFACQLGKPSHEVRDANVTSAEFQALYTHELVPALLGRQPQVIEWSGDGAARLGHVHMRPLRDFMVGAVAARLEGLQMQTKVIQCPTATISSDPPAWISELKPEPVTRGGLGLGPPAPRPPPPAAASPEAVTAELLREAMHPPPPPPPPPPPVLGSVIGGVRGMPMPAPVGAAPQRPPSDIESEVQRRAQPFGPTHHETQCGIKLRGARVVDAVARDASIGWARPVPSDDLRVQITGGRAANVLLVLESGAGVLLPAIPEYLCALTFDDDGELVDVAWEPSDNAGWRWDAYRERAQEIRTLRAIASASMARGSFKLERDDAFAIAQRMQVAKGIDPALGLYAAYAYHDLQKRDLIRNMAGYMGGDLGAPLFDVALLARSLDRKTIGADAPRVLGPMPLLAQGWSLLRAFEVKLPPAIEPLADMRLPSLWTMFDAKGVERLRHAIQQGDIR